ncbi:MAG TPA: LysR family transcriptional regulator [Afipia sp.]
MSNLPPLIALRAFEALGRMGSVRAAGDELGVSHTVVSRHIHNLEARLQVQLAEPLGRGLALTAEGVRFHTEVVKAFDIIVRATADLERAHRKTLEVWCVPGLANRRLLPLLSELTDNLPGYEIVLRPTLSRPNLERGEADAEVIYLSNSIPCAGRRIYSLAQPRVFPVASPAFCERFGRVANLESLLKLPLIHEESTEQWRRWFSTAGLASATPLYGLQLWHADLAIEAARLGQGVALTNDVLTAEDIRSGSLVELGTSNVSLGAYYLVCLEAREEALPLAMLRRWLTGIFGSSG